MAQATSSRGGSSKTQVQVESIDPPDSEPAKNHPEVTKGTESQIGNPEVSSREKRRHRASLARHSRKCSVCHHPDREFIDDDYLRWISPQRIARQYKISHHSVVYRHADATGLRTQRRAALRATLEHFIERAEDVRPTAHSIVSAVRLCAQINDQGQYTPSVRRHIVEHHYFGSPADAGPPADASAAAEASEPAARHETGGGLPSTTFAAPRADRAEPTEIRDGLQPDTSAAPSAAPLSESENEFRAVSPASGMAGRSAPAARATPAATVDFRDSNAAASQAATKKNDGSPSNTFAAPSAAPLSASQEKLTVAEAGAVRATPEANVAKVDKKDGLPSPFTTAATSAAPLSESQNKFPAVAEASTAPAAAVAQRTATQGAPSATKVETKDSFPSPFTSAATSAAPLSESKERFGSVAAPKTTSATVPVASTIGGSAMPLDESPENLPAGANAAHAATAASGNPARTVGSPVSNAAASQAATSAATSAAPLSESPENFPAVSVAVAPAPTKFKTTATPIITIYLQTNAISNRELLGLEHAATH